MPTRAAVAAALQGAREPKADGRPKAKRATGEPPPAEDDIAALSAPIFDVEPPSPARQTHHAAPPAPAPASPTPTNAYPPPPPSPVPRLAIPPNANPAVVSQARNSYGGDSNATGTTDDASDDEITAAYKPPSSPPLPRLATLPPRSAQSRPPPSPSRRPPTTSVRTPSGRALQEQAPPLRPEEVFGPPPQAQQVQRMELDGANRATFFGAAPGTARPASTAGFLHSKRPPLTARAPTNEENAVFAAQWLRVRERVANAAGLLSEVEGVVAELEAVSHDRVRLLAEEREAHRQARNTAIATGVVPPEMHGVAHLEARLAEAREELTHLRDSVSSLEKEKTNLKEKVSKLESENAAPSTEAYLALTSRVERDVSYLTEEIAHLKEENRDAADKLDAEMKRRAEAEAKAAQFQQGDALLKASRQREEEMEKENEEMEAELSDVNARLDAAETAEADAKAEASRLREELSAMQQSQAAAVEQAARDQQEAAKRAAEAERTAMLLASEASSSEAQKILRAAIEEERARASEREAQLQAMVDAATSARAEAEATAAQLQAGFEERLSMLRDDVKQAEALRTRNMEVEKQLETAMARYEIELRRRKELHNELVNLKGSIRVYCRIRPLLDFEARRLGAAAVTPAVVVDPALETVTTFDTARSTQPQRQFELDKVFASGTTQSDVFAEVEPLVTSVLDGYNVCIFAYGQTGSGKTFTMDGSSDAPGVNMRSISHLFKSFEERAVGGAIGITCTLSAIEVYNENVYDLLHTAAGNNSRPGSQLGPTPIDEPVETNKVDIRMTRDGGVYLHGLTETVVEDIDAVKRWIHSAKSNRATAGTSMNEHSSRSHLVITFTVTTVAKTPANSEAANGSPEQPARSASPAPKRPTLSARKKKSSDQGTTTTTTAKLNLIDLAGSERISKSEVTGERLKEAQAINKSLSALGDVISALGEKASHVPFRNSRLTHLLADSLGGQSKVAMFVNVSPAPDNVSETNSSLSFGVRARSVHLGPASKNVAVA